MPTSTKKRGQFYIKFAIPVIHSFQNNQNIKIKAISWCTGSTEIINDNELSKTFTSRCRTFYSPKWPENIMDIQDSLSVKKMYKLERHNLDLRTHV